MLDWTRRLIQLRRKSISLNDGDRGHIGIQFSEEQRWLRMDRGEVSVIANLGDYPAKFKACDGQRIVLASDCTAKLNAGQLTVAATSIVILSSEHGHSDLAQVEEE
jgi:maltooligosyltrehalose trehalohydrolase